MPDEKNKSEDFILLVEDDCGTCELEAQRLEPLGLELRLAYGAEEALAALAGKVPRLMIIDYSLPGTNALDFIAGLKKAGTQVPPFIVATGRGDEAVAVASMKAGASDYIIKNADFLDNLLPAVRKTLEKNVLLKELEAAQRSTARNLHLYSFLAQVNLAASQTKDRKALFRQICEIAVKTGGMYMAWIGLPDTDLGRIIPLCWAGAVGDYLKSIKIPIGAEAGEDNGPMGMAATRGTIFACSDIATAPHMPPWRDKALEQGYRSSASIPLKEAGRLSAVLTVYSEQPQFFNADELKLLNEIQADISLALDAISAEEKRAAAQAALERTAAQLAHIMDVTPVILFTLKELPTGGLITDWVSGNAAALTGYTPDEMLRPGWWFENMHPEDKQRVIEEQKCLREKERLSQDFRFRKKDGAWFWVHSQLNASMKQRGEVIGSWTDITQIKESEVRFQELFEKMPIGYHSLDETGGLLAVNDTWVDIFGYPREEALGRNFAEFLAPTQAAIFKERFSALKASGKAAGLQYEIQRKDGSGRRIALSARIARNPDGGFRQTHCIFTDITATWKAERQTHILNEAIKASFDEIYVLDPDSFKFIFVNKCALMNLGYTEEEMERLTPWDLKKTDFTEASFREAMKPLLQKRRNTIIIETANTRKDGTSYPIEVRLQFIETTAAPVFLAVANDITERKKGERMMAEMANMQRVESLGALAGGIAHDFNNMLTGITANLSLLGAKSARDPGNMEIIHDTIEAARNAQGLTAQLLAFSRGGQPVKKEFCLQKALKEIFKLSTSGTKASCDIKVPENLWSVEGDENQIKQALNNLLLNSVQAMPVGGRLTLTAENIHCGGLPAFAGGDCVKITVSDTGIGIPAQYLKRIFEPYFTTKNKGHGLGLSMTWSVVKNHGGHIEAMSVPGKGTTFEILLPATGRSLAEGTAAQPEIQKGSGRILVLEDEEIVSKALVRMLAQLGYTCEITADGNETVRVYAEAEKAGKPFSAVIMDLTIPGGLGGKEAVQELRQIAPKVPVIVSSGYSDEAVMADYKSYGFDAVLPKPYRYEDLAETLSRLLKE